MTLDIEDKNYIHSEITTEIKKALVENNKVFGAKLKNEVMTEVRKEFGDFRKEIQKDMDRHAGILLDQFKSEMKLVVELVSARPTRGEFDELTQDVRHLERRVTALTT